jgi:hypothetical protein
MQVSVASLLGPNILLSTLSLRESIQKFPDWVDNEFNKNKL